MIREDIPVYKATILVMEKHRADFNFSVHFLPRKAGMTTPRSYPWLFFAGSTPFRGPLFWPLSCSSSQLPGRLKFDTPVALDDQLVMIITNFVIKWGGKANFGMFNNHKGVKTTAQKLQILFLLTPVVLVGSVKMNISRNRDTSSWKLSVEILAKF